MKTKYIFGMKTPKQIKGVPKSMAWRITMMAGEYAEISLPWPDGTETHHLLRDDGDTWGRSHKILSREPGGVVNVETENRQLN